MSNGRRKSKEEVIEALHDVASEMHDKMSKGTPPTMTLPVRGTSQSLLLANLMTPHDVDSHGV